MMPKVMIVIATDILGGPGKGVFQLIDRLEKLDVKYLLVAFHLKGSDQSEFINLAQTKNYNLEIIEQEGSIDSSIFKQAKSIAKKHDINIVQTHGYKSHVIGMYLKYFLNMPWVAFTHGWTSENLKVKFYNLIEIILFRFATCKITVSPSIRKILLKWLTFNVNVVLNAVDKDEIRESNNAEYLRKEFNPDNDFVIGVIGRLSPEKGHKYLINAVKLISDEKVRVIIVGDGQERQSLVDLVNHLRLEKQVIFYGYSEYPGDVYKAIDLLVLPSLKEGLPNVVLEAMAYNVPVVSTNVGGVSEIIKNGINGWIVKPANSRLLADAISEILKNRAVYDKIKNSILSSIFPKFSPDHRALTMKNIYQGLLTKGPR